MRIVNFAHGDSFTLPLLVMGVLVPLLVEQAAAAHRVLCAGSGVWASRPRCCWAGLSLQVRPQRFQRDMTGSFVVSVGLAAAARVFLETFGGVPTKLPTLVEGTVNILGAFVTVQRLIITGCALLVAVFMCWTIVSSRLGKACARWLRTMRPPCSRAFPYRRIAPAGFLIATVLAAIAAVPLSPVTVSSPIIGNDYLIRGFIAIVIGGLAAFRRHPGQRPDRGHREPGRVLLDPTWATITMFALTMFVPPVRPKGILGNG